MSEIQSLVATIGNMVGLERTEVIENITQWNKEGVYPFSIIDIKVTPKGVTDNADFVGGLVAKYEAHIEDVIKNVLDPDVLLEEKKTLLEIGKYFKKTRQIQTAPLKEVAGHFTPHESKFDELNTRLMQQYEKMNEVEYKKREISLKEYFTELLKADGFEEVISLDAFKDFIGAKRKTKFYTSKGALNAKIKGEIEDAVRLVAEPIKEAKRLDEEKSKESKQFESYMENFNGDGIDNEKLGSTINQLIKFKESVPQLYPNIEEHCLRTIDNKIKLIEANIRGNKANAEKDAIKNADGELMATFDEINKMSQDFTLDIYSLKELVNQLRAIHPKLQFADNQEKVKSLGASLNARITELEVSAYSPKVEEKKPEPKPEPEQADSTELETYIVSVHDFDVLAGMEIQAGSEDIAKEELVSRFRAHLSMIQLVRKGN